MNWPRWLARHAAVGRRTRRLPATRRVTALPPAAPAPPAPRIVLRFRDGTAEVLDPFSDTAAALHTLAERLRTGR